MSRNIDQEYVKKVLDKHDVKDSEKLAPALTEILSEILPSYEDIENGLNHRQKMRDRGLAGY